MRTDSSTGAPDLGGGGQHSDEARVRGAGHRRPVALLILLGLAAYLSSARGGFVWDDVWLVLGDRAAPRGRVAGALLGFWSQHRGSLTPGYYPTRELSFALDRRLWGQNAWGFHVTSVSLHLASCLLLYALGVRLSGRRGTAFLWAALWCIHPAATECTNWLKNRTILLCSVASMGTLVLCSTLDRGSRNRHLLGGVVAAALMAVSLLCKEIAVVVPIVAVIVAACSPRLTLRHVRLPVAGLWVVLVVYLGLKGVAFGRGRDLARPPRDQSQPPLIQRVLKSYMMYANVGAGPFSLCADRHLDTPHHAPMALLMALCCVLAWWRGRLRWLLALGVAWFAIALFPASNLIYLSDRPLAEQRMYLALPGICGLLAALTVRRRWLTMLMLVALTALTVERHGVWASNHALWTTTIPQVPAAARPWLNLGNYYLNGSRYAASERYQRQALRRDPTWYAPWVQIGRARAGLKDPDGAIKHLEKALTLGRRPDIHFDLAGCYAERGPMAQALGHCKAALMLDPSFTDARVRMALVYLNQGDEEAAGRTLEEAVSITPGSAWAQFELGNYHYKHRRYAEALKRYQVARALQPESHRTLQSMGEVLHVMGRPQAAREAFERSLALNARNWKAWQGLGHVAEVADELGRARACYGQALALNPQANISQARLTAVNAKLTPANGAGPSSDSTP